MQMGTNEDEAKVFRAHAILQGLCDNLINALSRKMVIAQFKNIIMCLEEKCRERITNRRGRH